MVSQQKHVLSLGPSRPHAIDAGQAQFQVVIPQVLEYITTQFLF